MRQRVRTATVIDKNQDINHDTWNWNSEQISRQEKTEIRDSIIISPGRKTHHCTKIIRKSKHESIQLYLQSRESFEYSGKRFNPNLFFRHTLISIIKDYFTSDDSQIYSKHINWALGSWTRLVSKLMWKNHCCLFSPRSSRNPALKFWQLSLPVFVQEVRSYKTHTFTITAWTRSLLSHRHICQQTIAPSTVSFSLVGAWSRLLWIMTIPDWKKWPFMAIQVTYRKSAGMG